MSVESYLDRVIGGLEKDAVTAWDELTTFTSKGMAYIKNFFTVLVPDEISALAPYAEQALSEAGDAIPTLIGGLISSGSPAVALTDYVTALAPVLVATAQKAEAAGVTAAGAAVSTAVQAAVANIAASQTAPTPVVPPAAD